MTMNDWDGISGNHDEAVEQDSASQAVKKDDTKNVVAMPGNAAKNNNKTMYLVMGGLMLFVMGVFGYTKYMEFQGAQNDERVQQQLAAKQKKEEMERKKNAAEAAAQEKLSKPAVPEKDVADQAQASSVQLENSDLAALAQLKTKSTTSVAPALNTTAAAQASSVNGNPAVPSSTTTTTPAAAAVAQTATPQPAVKPISTPASPASGYSQGAQNREQYISMLEGRINELGLSKLRLEAELCKHEPKRPFCNQTGKPAVTAEPTKEVSQQLVKSSQPATGSSGRVMLFDSGKTNVGNTTQSTRPSNMSNGANAANVIELVRPAATPVPAQTARSPLAEPAPKIHALQGFSILRDRVLYRDRDGLTHEVELGGEMEGMGRLERIDFERKSFQAGGRTYN